MRYRIYYNSSEDAQRWSVDEGSSSTEITVMDIRIQGLLITTRTTDDRAFQPRAWIEVEGQMQIDQGIAIFTADAP